MKKFKLKCSGNYCRDNKCTIFCNAYDSSFTWKTHANKLWDLNQMSSMNCDMIDSILHSNDTFWWNKMTNLMPGWWTVSVQWYLSRVELWEWIMKQRRLKSDTSSGPSSGVHAFGMPLSNSAINATDQWRIFEFRCPSLVLNVTHSGTGSSASITDTPWVYIRGDWLACKEGCVPCCVCICNTDEVKNWPSTRNHVTWLRMIYVPIFCLNI
jgi:hypothetical protein